jgi:hypothetical protein
MAFSDKFRIDVKGVGGHGAHPQGTVDAIVEAAALVTALQTVVSRNMVPLSLPLPRSRSACPGPAPVRGANLRDHQRRLRPQHHRRSCCHLRHHESLHLREPGAPPPFPLPSPPTGDDQDPHGRHLLRSGQNLRREH